MLRSAGVATVVASLAAFLVGLLSYLTGFEVAAVLMMLALGTFVSGIGLLAAADRPRG
jgi:hypothetical protein